MSKDEAAQVLRQEIQRLEEHRDRLKNLKAAVGSRGLREASITYLDVTFGTQITNIESDLTHLKRAWFHVVGADYPNTAPVSWN